jgi:hypothetical protein
MKKLLLATVLFTVSNLTYGQMISVTGGNLNLHEKNKGYIEVEAMQHISHNVAAHISYTKTIGGYDIAMVGGRYGFLKNRVGGMISACFMENHKTMAMVGVDVKPFKNNPISLTYNVSSDNKLKTFGLKFPLFPLFNKQH